MDIDYWERYYAEKRLPGAASKFAEFVFEQLGSCQEGLLELGCGNGRDATYFAQRGIRVLAIDQCVSEIAFLNENVNRPGLDFLAGDFTDLDSFDESGFGCVYSRFTLHSIESSTLQSTILGAYQKLRPGGVFCAEFRGKKNELYGVGEQSKNDADVFFYDGHHRRFLCSEEMGKKLKAIGFSIVLQDERKGFAPHNGTDHIFARIVAKKVDG